jgi:hypothetical protein
VAKYFINHPYMCGLQNKSEIDLPGCEGHFDEIGWHGRSAQ